MSHTATSDEKAEQDRADNLDVLLTSIKDQVTAQRAQITALDGKANFSLATAGLLTAGAASLHSAFVSLQRPDVSKPVVFALPRLDPAVSIPIGYVLAVIAFAVFLWIVYESYQAYKLRPVVTVPNAKNLLNEYWNSPTIKTKGDLAATLADAVEKTDETVSQKVRHTQTVLLLLVVEALVLLLMTILQVLL